MIHLLRYTFPQPLKKTPTTELEEDVSFDSGYCKHSANTVSLLALLKMFYTRATRALPFNASSLITFAVGQSLRTFRGQIHHFLSFDEEFSNARAPSKSDISRRISALRMWSLSVVGSRNISRCLRFKISALDIADLCTLAFSLRESFPQHHAYCRA